MAQLCLHLVINSMVVVKSMAAVKSMVVVKSMVGMQVTEAVKYVHRALQRRRDHLHSLHLLALLFSAQKQFDDAYALIETTLAQYPDNFRCRYIVYADFLIIGWHGLA